MAVNIEHEDAAYSRQESLALAAENLGAAAEKLQARHGAAVRKRSLLPNELPPPPRTVASRLMAILLTFRSGNSHSLTEIAALTGLPMSTVHRLACEMATLRLLQRQPGGRAGRGAAVVGAGATRASTVIRAASSTRDPQRSGYLAAASAERRCSALACTSRTGPSPRGSSVRIVSCSRTYHPS
jgi:hypothetical protein